MRKIGLILLLVATIAVAVVTEVRAQCLPPTGKYPTLDAWRLAGCQNESYGPNGYYQNGYHGYGPYGYGPGPNVDFRTQERWERDKGDRRVEQTQNLPAKVIDAATVLGVMAIIFH